MKKVKNLNYLKKKYLQIFTNTKKQNLSNKQEINWEELNEEIYELRRKNNQKLHKRINQQQ